MTWVAFISFFLLSSTLGVTLVASPWTGPRMEDCEPKICGQTNVTYPFWLPGQQPSYCGFPSFGLACDNNVPTIQISGQDYYIQGIFYQNKSMLVANTAYVDGSCPVAHLNVSLDLTSFSFSSANKALLFYYCPDPPPNQYTVSCASTNTSVYLGGSIIMSSHINSSNKCDIVVAPALAYAGANSSDYATLLKNGFLLDWTVPDCTECATSGGKCGYENTTQQFICICADGDHSTICEENSTKKRKIVIGLAAAVSGLLLACTLFFLYQFQHNRLPMSILFWKEKSDNAKNIEAFLEHYGSLAPKRYRYCDVKKITKSFRDKLGQGGYGTVYKGSLGNGCLVAVKMLSSSKGNGDEFVNEVSSIGRTSHVNIVSLLGFCSEGSKRALLYEFMPNGSLDKYIYSERPELTLGLERLYQIAIGIARGLEYLHRGCSTRIVHFDIKPHNILLDQEFCPKIADFGLAKLCPPKVSTVSMAGARGTIGYIAPEVFSRNFGVVSSKSDVYSYGMMVLEMVGGRQNIDAGVRNTSEVYFPHWIYERLERDGDLQVHGITTETEEIARKMILVGLWCIQTQPRNRPSISKVLDMLQGSVNDLPMPPKPFLSGPSESVIASSTDLTSYHGIVESNSLDHL